MIRNSSRRFAWLRFACLAGVALAGSITAAAQQPIVFSLLPQQDGQGYVTISNDCKQPETFSFSTNVKWIELSGAPLEQKEGPVLPYTKEYPPGPSTYTFPVHAGNLAPGSYPGTVTVACVNCTKTNCTKSAESGNLAVTLEIMAPPAPPKPGAGGGADPGNGSGAQPGGAGSGAGTGTPATGGSPQIPGPAGSPVSDPPITQPGGGSGTGTTPATTTSNGSGTTDGPGTTTTGTTPETPTTVDPVTPPPTTSPFENPWIPTTIAGLAALTAPLLTGSGKTTGNNTLHTTSNPIVPNTTSNVPVTTTRDGTVPGTQAKNGTTPGTTPGTTSNDTPHTVSDDTPKTTSPQQWDAHVEDDPSAPAGSGGPTTTGNSGGPATVERPVPPTPPTPVTDGVPPTVSNNPDPMTWGYQSGSSTQDRVPATQSSDGNNPNTWATGGGANTQDPVPATTDSDGNRNPNNWAFTGGKTGGDTVARNQNQPDSPATQERAGTNGPGTQGSGTNDGPGTPATGGNTPGVPPTVEKPQQKPNGIWATAGGKGASQPQPGDRNEGGGRTFDRGATPRNLAEANRPVTQDETMIAQMGVGSNEEYATRERKLQQGMANLEIAKESSGPIAVDMNAIWTGRQPVPQTVEKVLNAQDQKRMNFIDRQIIAARARGFKTSEKAWTEIKKNFGMLNRDFLKDLDDLIDTDNQLAAARTREANSIRWNSFSESGVLESHWADDYRNILLYHTQGATAVNDAVREDALMAEIGIVGQAAEMAASVGLGEAANLVPRSQAAAPETPRSSARSSAPQSEPVPAQPESEPAPAQPESETESAPRSMNERPMSEIPVDPEGKPGTRLPYSDYLNDPLDPPVDPVTGKPISEGSDVGAPQPPSSQPSLPAPGVHPKGITKDVPAPAQPSLNDRPFRDIPVDPNGAPGTRLPYSDYLDDPLDPAIDPQSGLPIPEKTEVMIPPFGRK